MDIVQYLIFASAISFGFFSQAVVGFAASLLSYPILLSFISLKDANALYATFYITYSLFLVPKNWKDVDKTIFKTLFFSQVVGMILGVFLLQYGNPIFLKKALGVFIILFVLNSVFNTKKFHLPPFLSHVFGFLGGIFSGLFSAGGPPLVTYIYSKTSDKTVMRATIIGVFAVTNIMRVPLLIQSGILTVDAFFKSLTFFPFFLVAVFLGQYLFTYINEKVFKKIIMPLLLFSGISLLW